MGHYHEPDLSLTFPMATEDCTTEYCLHYNPLTGFWNVTLPKSSVFHIEKNSDNNFIVVSKSTLNVNTSEEAPKLATPKQEGVVVEKSEAMEILPAMDVLETKDYEILIGNEHEKIDSETKNSHRWTVFVRASDPNFNLKDIVEKVDFELHPTFFPARVAVFESPFQVERIGWGIFTVPVKICFKNGKTVSFEHQLSFQNDVTQVVHTVKV